MKYRYGALAVEGEAEEGIIEALSVQEAIRQLDKKGLTVYSIEPDQTGANLKGKIRKTDTLRFFEELVTLLNSGVTLSDALDSQAENQQQPLMRSVVSAISQGLQQGKQFSEELAKAKELNLPDYMIQLASAGELTGKLAASLEKGIEQMQFEETLAGEMKNALMYPAILVCSGVVAVGLVFSLVVPKFTNLLDGQAELPWLAAAVLRTGLFFNQNGLWIVLALLGVLVAAMTQLAKPEVRVRVLGAISRLPLVGQWLAETETGRWTSVLSALLGSGVPIIKSLELANSGVVINRRRRRLENALFAVKGGEPLSSALQAQEALTPIAYNILRVGERAGELPAMLASLAKLYEKSGRDRMKRVLILIEPLAILLIGGTIGTIIIGIVLAITSASDIPL